METSPSGPYNVQCSLYSTTDHLIQHPILGNLQILEDNTQHRILKSKLTRFQVPLHCESVTQFTGDLSHLNIIKILSIKPAGIHGDYNCFFEYFSGTLADEIASRVRQKTRYTEEQIIRIMQGVMSALAYLQTKKRPYGNVETYTIVKTGSEYKLIHPALLLERHSVNELAKDNISLSQIDVLEESNFMYRKISESDHKRHKNDIYAFGSVILDAMTLCTDITVTIHEKLARASANYTSELIGIVNKMMERITSLRIDCVSCEQLLKELSAKGPRYTQSSSNISHRRRASSVNSKTAYVKNSQQNSNLNRTVNPFDLEEFTQSRASKEPNMFRDILRTALPTPQNKDKFFANLPKELSDAAEDLLEKTFSVRTHRGKNDTSADVHRDSSFFSTKETAKKVQSHILVRESDAARPRRERISKDPVNFMVHRRKNLQLEDLHLDPKSSEDEFRYHIPHGFTAKPRQMDSSNSTEMLRNHHTSVRDFKTEKDHSTDYLTNTSSTYERLSPHYNGFLTSRSKFTDNSTAQRQQRTFQFGQGNHSNLRVRDSNMKDKSSHKKFRPLMPNDMRLPSFGDDHDYYRSHDYDLDALSEHPSNLFTTPKPKLTTAKKSQFTPIQSIQSGSQRKSQYQSHSQSRVAVQFITEVYPDGSVYRGEGTRNLRHGVGRMTFRDGSCYEGEWYQDNMEGYGVFFYANGTIAYEGEWQHNKCNGQGVLYNQKPKMMSGSNPEHLDRKKEGTWTRYEGGFCNDKWEGEGKLVFTNGDEFCGDFVSDLIHGFGKYIIAGDGMVYEGEWANNEMIKLSHSYPEGDMQE